MIISNTGTFLQFNKNISFADIGNFNIRISFLNQFTQF